MAVNAATPRPWRASGLLNLLDGDGKAIAHFSESKDRDLAEYAVNAHDALVEALHMLISVGDKERWPKVFANAEAALALAKAQP